MNRVAVLLVVAAGCSSKTESKVSPSSKTESKVSPTTPSPGSWKPWLPALVTEGSESARSRIVEMHFDTTGVWRCTLEHCEHADLDGKVTASIELPCGMPAFSPTVTLVASACATRDEQNQQVYEIVVDDLLRGTRETRPTKVEAGFRIVVDDAGVVTGIDFPPTKVSRSSAKASVTLPISVPASPVDAGLLAPAGDGVIPAVGPWLAYTVERPTGDVAWRDDASATMVRLDGNVVLYDHDQFLMKTGKRYIEVSTNGVERPLLESPPPKLKDALDDLGFIERWGKDGIYAMYVGSSLMQLRDRDGHVRYVLPLPDIDGRVGFDPSGARAYFWYDDGRVVVWDGPLN